MTGSYDMSRLTLLARCVSAKFIWTDKLLSRGSKKALPPAGNKFMDVYIPGTNTSQN